MVFKPCILIPVYNHEHAMPTMMARIAPLAVDCLLVNDGSNADCSRVLQQLAAQYPRVTLIEHDHNQGKGAAFKTGLREAAARGYSHVVQIDADGQHEVDDIPRFLALGQLNPAAIINGVAMYDETVPKLRQYGRYITHFWVWVNTLSLSIRDSMCGFRLYPVASTLQLVNEETIGNRMDFDSEILVRSHWRGIPIIALPTRVHYPLDGVSHFQALRDNAMISLMHTRLFFFMLGRLPGWLLGRRRPG